MRRILSLNAKSKEEALDALQKAMISLETDVDPDDVNIQITVSAPDEKGFTFFINPNEID